jgi:2-polyprenyl-3-methyl-5-hydroxy-6-metoxy-1,4-benzoquinol methylase
MTAPPPFLWPDEAPGQQTSVRPCPSCGEAGPKAVLCLSAPGASRYWRLLRCPACACGFFEDQAIADYADEGMAGASATYFVHQGAAVAIFADILAHIRKPPGAAYVEIGCGFGFGLDIGTHAMGWRCRGMDPAKLAEAGRDLLGVDIALTYFSPETVADASCDIVMATEVLEHLPDPRGFLREVRRGLKPDGIVVLTTPDVGAIRPKIAKPMLSSVLSIGLHLILHSRTSMEGALRAAGFPHIRIESDGWTLTAFGSAVPLDLRDDPAERHAIVTRYLVGQAMARAETDDLFIGFAGRAFFDAVCALDMPAAQEVWIRLDAALRTRYRIDIDTITAPPAGIGTIALDAIGATMPFNLPAIMLGRAYQRLEAGEPRLSLLPRFRAIRAVCGPLSARLESANIGDMQSRQILWVADAEELLCLAAAGNATVPWMIGRLQQSPTGAGREDVVRRAIEILIHGEKPFLAAWLARAEGCAHMRRPGDLSAMAVLKSFFYECGYRLRRRVRGQ